MQDRPTALELAEAVREFLESEVIPTLQDPRLRFRSLVAANALGILGRDLKMSEDLLKEEIELLEPLLGLPGSGTPRTRALALNLELARRIRRGEPPPGTLEALRRIADLKLQISSPRYRGRPP
jgi:hypothetical protein